MRTPKRLLITLTLLSLTAVALMAWSAPAIATVGHRYLSQISETPLSAPVSGAFGRPTVLAIDHVTGDSFIVDSARSVVDVFNGAGVYQTQFGADAESRRYLEAVAVDEATGDVYVVEVDNEGGADYGVSVGAFKLGLSGEYEPFATWTGGNTEAHSFGGDSASLAVDNSSSAADPHAGDLYVVDGERGLVDILKLRPPGPLEAEEGELVGSLYVGTIGDSTSVNVAVASAHPAGEVYVGIGAYVNGEDNTVEVFNASGVAQSSLHLPGSAFGSVGQVAVDDSTGEVYVADAGSHAIDQFSSSGTYISRITEAGLPAQPFSEPVGVGVGANGELVVADSASKVIDLFEAGVTPQAPSTQAATSITTNSATLNGTLTPEAREVEFYFAYGEGACIGAGSITTPVDNGGAPVPAHEALEEHAEITGLRQGRTYSACLVAQNIFGPTVDVSAGVFFTTHKLSAQTGEVSNVSQNAADVTGVVNPLGLAGAYYYQYGLTTGYGATTAPLATGESSSEVPAPGTLEDLVPDTIYHYRLVAVNGDTSSYGEDRQLRTPAYLPPVATTGAASGVGINTATISGSVDPEGIPTTYEFQIGTDTNYGARVFASAQEGSESEQESASLAGLQSATTYHYRLCATNEANAGSPVCGADATFTTEAVVSPLLQPAILPFLATPAIVFPKAGGTTTVKTLTNAQKLASALKACGKKPKKQRASCERAAHKKYGVKSKKK